MTTTSPTRARHRLRFSGMETLGFAETPYDSNARVVSRQHTTLVSTRAPLQGKHVRRVEELWDATELHTTSLVDWAPTGADKRLSRRVDFRWSVSLALLLATLAVAAIAFWLYQQPAESAARAREELTVTAGELDLAVDQLTRYVAALTSGSAPTGEQTGAVIATKSAAENLFDAAAALAASDPAARSAAIDASEAAGEAARLVSDGLTYRTILEPALTLPALETNSNLVNITTATQSFLTWRAHMAAVLEGLSSGFASEVTREVGDLVNDLEEAQTAYVDFLRLEDKDGAESVLAALQARLDVIGQDLATTIEEVAALAADRIDTANRALAGLLG